ncbi:MAG: hypothetical protein AAFO86_07910 [Pseudomonadota bacterium]
MAGEQPQPARALAYGPPRTRHDDLCRQELLISAAEGALPADHCLERKLDHLERAR